MRAVVVTGVSTGIGRGVATVLARNGFHVFGSVRHADHGADFEKVLSGNGTALVFDVTDQAAVLAAAERVRERVGNDGLVGLVNNAGITVLGPLESIDLAALRHQFNVNAVAQIGVSQAFLPLLKTATPPGRIVNISSGGRIAIPFIGPYAASKFALEGLSDALRRELVVHGVEVILVRPGSVDTPLWEKAAAGDTERYRDTPYLAALEKLKRTGLKIGKGGLPAETVGQTVLAALTAPRPRSLYVARKGGLLAFDVTPYLPRRFLDRMIAGRLGLPRKR